LLRARIAFLKQGYEAYFHIDACLLCYVVIGPPSYRDSRLRQLRAWTAQLLAEEDLEEWTSVFRFTAVDMDRVYTQSLFAAPQWYIARESPPVPLLDTTTPTKQPASMADKENSNGHSILA
jgi:hypothetical protein